MDELETFLSEIRAGQNTKRIYKNTLRLFRRQYGHLPESSAEAQEYIRKREKAGLAPATIGLDVAAFLRYLRFQGIATNRLERMPVTLKTPEYLTKDEIKALMAGFTVQPKAQKRPQFRPLPQNLKKPRRRKKRPSVFPVLTIPNLNLEI